MKKTLTVCVICNKLESNFLQNYLPECMQSIPSIANEIIVFTNNPDDIYTVTNQFNCNVISMPDNDNYAAIWNEAIQYATGEFILFINGDEYITTPTELTTGLSFMKQNRYMIPGTKQKIGAIMVNLQADNQLAVRLVINDKNIKFDNQTLELIDNNTLKANSYYIAESNINIAKLYPNTTSSLPKINDSKIQPNAIDTNKLLSVCMIVKNEEEMLPGCLESIKNVADEIVIVDTGSNDKTVEIAKQFKAKVHHFAWTDDFAEARNQSLKYATGQWILYLDADERLTPASQQQIRPLIQTAEEDTGAYFCTLESEHRMLDGSSEKHRGGYPRLFKNLIYPNINFVGRVHEQISPSIIAMKKSLLRSDLIIEHLGYNLPEDKMNEKVQRNYKMLIAHVNEEPTNGYAWFQLGQTLGQMEVYDKAEESILFAIKCGDLKPPVLASAAATLSQFRGKAKDFQNALYWAEESLKQVPNQLYGLSLKAHSLLYLGRKQEAEVVFIQAINFMKENQQMPRSGFDIDVSEEILVKGLTECKKP